jgi:hypothetical protein
VDDASSPLQTLARFSHPILGREPDAHFLLWMVPSGILLSHYPVGPVASPRCVARSSYYFGESEVHYAASSSLLIFWDSQLTSDHLTQARAILRPVRPSGRSPNNAAIYAYIPPLTKNAVTRANAKFKFRDSALLLRPTTILGARLFQPNDGSPPVLYLAPARRSLRSCISQFFNYYFLH